MSSTLFLNNPGRRGVGVALCGFLAAGVALGVSGCKNDTAKPVAEARYRSLGPKENFPDYLRGTILEVVDVGGIQPLIISGYGVVVNLPNTGADDGIPTQVRESVLDAASRLGLESVNSNDPMGALSVGAFLADPRTAIVRVDGIVPPGAHIGDRIDVRVSALPSNSTASLVGGTLYQTELHAGLVTAQQPGERVNKVGGARGNVLVNPIYAAEDLKEFGESPAARQSLRAGIIPDGGVFDGGRDGKGRFFVLKLREPGYRTARLIEQRINYFFAEPQPVAAAQDEGMVLLRLPDRFEGDWRHFINLATRLFRDTTTPARSIAAADRLNKAAIEPGRTPEDLEAISFAWEGLGRQGVVRINTMLNDPNPAVAYAAARASAAIGDAAGEQALLAIARDSKDPYAVAATRSLGDLGAATTGGPGAAVIRDVSRLLASPNVDVRIAAYESLLKLGGERILTINVGEQFYLDVVPGAPDGVIYAKRSGTPRIAVIGGRFPHVSESAFVSVFGTRLTISRDDENSPAAIFHRPVVGRPRQAEVNPAISDLIARLGGFAPDGELGIYLSYGEVLAVLNELCASEGVVSEGTPVRLVLEDEVFSPTETAPIIPGLEDLTAAAGG